MGLETVTYLGDLDPANPTGADPKRLGDDHLRNIKLGLKNCFPGYTGAVLICGAASGVVNNYTLSPPSSLVAYTANAMVVFRPNTTNTTDAPTLNVSGLGPRQIRAVDGNPLRPGDIVANQYTVLIDTGTEYRLAAVTKGYIDSLVFESAFPTPPAGGGPYFLSYSNGAFSYVTSQIPDFLLQAQGIA